MSYLRSSGLQYLFIMDSSIWAHKNSIGLIFFRERGSFFGIYTSQGY